MNIKRLTTIFLLLLLAAGAAFASSCDSFSATSATSLAASAPPPETEAPSPTPRAPTEALTPTRTLTPTLLATHTPPPTVAPTSTLSAVLPGLTDLLAGSSLPVYSYTIVNTYPHDRGAYTQGLVYTDGALYEGTGYWAQSSLRKVALETGQVIQIRSLPVSGLFGEGITIWGDKIVQLTWRAQPGSDTTGFVYDKGSFEHLDTFTYLTEGWGITHDGTKLIMSDGTATLYFWDPETLEEIGKVQVHDDRGPVVRLNELEYIDGEVFANVWQTNLVARIDPQTGQLTAWIDLSGLLSPEDYTQPVDVLNGIAYDVEGDRLFVTGKWWPKLFEIELVAPTPQQVFLPVLMH